MLGYIVEISIWAHSSESFFSHGERKPKINNIHSHSLKYNKKKPSYHNDKCLYVIDMVSQERFELPTHSLEGCCSILLSYWDIV